MAVWLTAIAPTVSALDLAKKWEADVITDSSIMTQDVVALRVGKDFSAAIDIKGNILWIDPQGKLLTTLPSPYSSPNPVSYAIQYVSATNLIALGQAWSGSYKATNTSVVFYAIIGDFVARKEISIAGNQINPGFLADQTQFAPLPCFIVLNGKKLICYAVEGQEFSQSVTLSAPVLTNGIIRTSVDNPTANSASIQATSDLTNWTIIRTLAPRSKLEVTSPVTNSPLFLRGITP